MRKLILSTVAVFALIGVAKADILDDNLAKAEKSVISATKRLEAAKQCIANRPVCLADLTTKAQKSSDRAAAKLAALKSANAE